VLAAHPALPARARTQAAGGYRRRVPYWALTREPGPAWDRSTPMREQPGWGAHAQFMNGLGGEGFILVGGPLGKGERRFHFLVDAESEDEIRSRLEADPWTASGHLRIASIEPWELVLGRPNARRRG
jgi:uncharacterized protein YciI